MANEELSENLFYKRLSRYMELSERQPKLGDSKSEELDELLYDLHQELTEMVMQGETSDSDVIQAFAQLFSEFPHNKGYIIFLMEAVKFTSNLKGGHDYPEFFWIILEAGYLAEKENIYQLIYDLRHVCDPKILRSYLVYRLTTGVDQSQLKNLVWAFYHTGHTIETIKIVADRVPFDASNEQAYGFLYSDAMSLLFTDYANTLNDDDRAYLKAFFERGFQFGSPWITESCEKGLEKLSTWS